MTNPARKPLLTAQALQRARRLRHDSTLPERILWGSLRGAQLAGLKFRRQHSIGPFVVDFYCHEAKLVVELDGDSHIGRADADSRRTQYLESQGLRVLRVNNDDVIQDLEAVWRGILLACGLDLNATAKAVRKTPSP